VNKIPPKYMIKVLNKSFSILNIFLEQKSPISMTEISRKLNFNLSTVQRIIETLRYGGYIEQDPISQKYQLGLKLLELGMAKFHQISLIKEATPYLKELVGKFNETVHLGILEDIDVLYLAKEESSQIVRMVSYVGSRAPVHCTGLGKVLLAHLPLSKRKNTLDKIKLSRRTKNTITDRECLEIELDRIEKEGFALDKEENEKDVSCIAAPIRNYQGRVIAAVSISGPSYRINEKNQKQLKKEIITTCQKISSRIGFQLNK